MRLDQLNFTQALFQSLKSEIQYKYMHALLATNLRILPSTKPYNTQARKYALYTIAMEETSDMASNTTYRVEPKEAHTHTVIFLHGRDSKGKEFADEFFESEASGPVEKPRTLLDLFPTIRWVFPGAPMLQSERFGIEMHQWFDMWSVENPAERPELQQPGLRQSIEQVSCIIKEEECLIPRLNIFLCGISQGFAVAIATYFSEKQGEFAGLIGLSSWMPPTLPYIQEKRQGKNLGEVPEEVIDTESSRYKTPVFLGHSVDDHVVPIKNGRELRDIISLQGFQVKSREYQEGGHWINEPQGVDDIANFLTTNMITHNS